MYPRTLLLIAIFLWSGIIFPQATENSVPASSSSSSENSHLVQIQKIAIEKKLHQKQYWLRLGHYKKRWLGGYKSEADGGLFFLAREGKVDPQQELIATLQGFFLGDAIHPTEMHPQCRFPERLRWLDVELKFKHLLPDVDCSRFENWKSESNIGSAQIVFASYYLNNPASLFGHTFLKLVRRNSNVNNDLLNHGVNYAANPTTLNPLFYAILGLSGGFPGTYTMFPYYLKVNEYADFESRDLWEYSLKLNEEQLDRLVNHLWELGSTHFDYFYFNENCSYQILTLLEVAVPEVDLSSRLIYVVQPIDTVKILKENTTLLGEVKFRPSQLTEYLLKYRNLRRQNRDEVSRAISEKSLPADSLSVEERAEILETILDFYDYKYGREIKDEAKTHKNLLLKERAKLGKVQTYSASEFIPQEQAVDGHETSQFRIRSGVLNSFPVFELTWRPAMRELIDDPFGYSPYLQMLMMGFTGRLYRDSDNEKLHFIFHDWEIISIYSMAPVQENIVQPSWSVQIGAQNLSLETGKSINGRTNMYAQAGLGPSFSIPVLKELLVYSLIQARFDISDSFGYGWRLAPVLTTGMIWRIFAAISLQSQFDYRHFVITDDLPIAIFENKLNIGFNKSFAGEAGYRWYPNNRNQEIFAGFKYYL